MLISPQVELAEYDDESYILHNGRERYFVINRDSYDLITILRESWDFDEAFRTYCLSNDDIPSLADFESHVKQLFRNKGILSTEENEDNALKRRRRSVWFRLTLLSAGVAGQLSRLLSPLYHKKIFPAAFAAAVIGSLFLLYRYNDSGFSTAPTSREILFPLIIFVLSIVIHELGHVSACKRYGGRHGGIGVGLYFILPVFWADIHGIWMLPKKERLMINLAGIYVQLLIGLFLAVLHALSGKAFLMNSSLLICSSALFQLWPFIRLDGYWFMSDWLDIPNLNRISLERTKYIIRYYLSGAALKKDRTAGFSKKEIILFFYTCVSYGFLLVLVCYLIVLLCFMFI